MLNTIRPWIGVAALLCFTWSGVSSGMGKSPSKPPSETLPTTASVAGFDPAVNAEAFVNYNIWDKSILPAFLQVYHCTGMALFARQVFNFGAFDPTLPQVTAAEYETILRQIYNVPTPTLPGVVAKTVIPGYANWYEMTEDPNIVEVVKDILGDALGDILRPNFNWTPFDLIGSTNKQRTLIELNLRQTVAAGRVAMIYLTSGLSSAHSVLLYGYVVLPDRVTYTMYDSNHPGVASQMDFMFAQAQFNHPDFGMRNPWILHPYGDEFTSTETYLRSQ